ncbi:hypothetical protein ACFL21_05500 [Patescibacteria group bacterium]
MQNKKLDKKSENLKNMPGAETVLTMFKPLEKNIAIMNKMFSTSESSGTKYKDAFKENIDEGNPKLPEVRENSGNIKTTLENVIQELANSNETQTVTITGISTVDDSINLPVEYIVKNDDNGIKISAVTEYGKQEIGFSAKGEPSVKWKVEPQSFLTIQAETGPDKKGVGGTLRVGDFETTVTSDFETISTNFSAEFDGFLFESGFTTTDDMRDVDSYKLAMQFSKYLEAGGTYSPEEKEIMFNLAIKASDDFKIKASTTAEGSVKLGLNVLLGDFINTSISYTPGGDAEFGLGYAQDFNKWSSLQAGVVASTAEGGLVAVQVAYQLTFEGL